MTTENHVQATMAFSKQESHGANYRLANYIKEHGGIKVHESEFSKHSDAGYFSGSDHTYVCVYRGATIVLFSHITMNNEKKLSANYLEIKVAPKNPDAENILKELQEYLQLRNFQ